MDGIVVETLFQFWEIFEAVMFCRWAHVDNLMDKALLVFFSLLGLILEKSGSSFVLSDSHLEKGNMYFFQDLNETKLFIILI